MQYIVWHANEPNWGHGQKPAFPEEYKRVAVVTSDGIDDVFRITNHIEDSWTKNPEVNSLPDGPQQRSTSVGDVVEEFRPDGKKFYCDNFGWGELTV